MSQQSIIEHKANMYYVEFREDYLAICLACTYKKPMKDGRKSKASPYCQALILAIMEHWTNDKRGKGESLYVFMSYAQWIEAMYSMFGRTVVIDSIDELLGEKFISREPYKMFGRDTFKYLLSTKLVNERMKALPDRDPHITRPQVNVSLHDPSTSNLDPSTSNLDPSTSKRVTRPQVNGTRPQVDDDPSTSNHNIYSYIDSTQTHNIDSTEESVPSTTSTPQPSLEEVSSSETHSLFSEEKNANVTQVETAPPKKPRTIKPPKPKADNDTQKRIDGVYAFFSKLGQEATKNPSFTYSPTKKATDAIKEWIKGTPTQETLREVYFALWNTPKGTRTGFDWKENMTIPAVLNQYTTRSMAIEAKRRQQEARHVVIVPTKTTYQPPLEEEDDLPSAYVPISMRRKAVTK